MATCSIIEPHAPGAGAFPKAGTEHRSTQMRRIGIDWVLSSITRAGGLRPRRIGIEHGSARIRRMSTDGEDVEIKI